jgi:ATP-dependent DNA ligase
MEMIKQCKGKMLDKVPTSKLLSGPYYLSIKYDGNYCQIHKKGKEVTVFSSGNKPIKLNDLGYELSKIDSDFILECEFIGESEGKLGDRTKCGMMTTWRTRTAKGLQSNCNNNRFMVFDIIEENLTFQERLRKLNSLELPKQLVKVNHILVQDINRAKQYLGEMVNKNYEGIYLKHPKHLYKPGKRVNDAVKLKGRPTADLLCIDILEGEGKYQDMIGSLVLTDKLGRIVKVGSGLDDNDRAKHKSYFLDKIIEIEYEQILDTYIQPTYIRIRDDKKEID